MNNKITSQWRCHKSEQASPKTTQKQLKTNCSISHSWTAVKSKSQNIQSANDPKLAHHVGSIRRKRSLSFEATRQTDRIFKFNQDEIK